MEEVTARGFILMATDWHYTAAAVGFGVLALILFLYNRIKKQY